MHLRAPVLSLSMKVKKGRISSLQFPTFIPARHLDYERCVEARTGSVQSQFNSWATDEQSCRIDFHLAPACCQTVEESCQEKALRCPARLFTVKVCAVCRHWSSQICRRSHPMEHVKLNPNRQPAQTESGPTWQRISSRKQSFHAGLRRRVTRRHCVHSARLQLYSAPGIQKACSTSAWLSHVLGRSQLIRSLYPCMDHP